MISTSKRLVLVGAVIALLFAAPAPAQADSCIPTCLAVRAEDGISLGGGSGATTYRLASLRLAALAEMAIAEDPQTGLLAGLMVETIGRLGVGSQVGLRAHMAGGRMRISGIVDFMFAPYTMLGAGVEVGGCRRLHGSDTKFCLDVHGSAHFWGSDLPENQVVAQFSLVLGAEFDVF